MARLQVVREDDGFDLPKLGVEDGTAFGWFDRWNMGTSIDGKYVVDLSDWEARDMHAMLTKDYKAKQMEAVLTLPVTAAEYTIQPVKGDKGEAEWLKNYFDSDMFAGGCRTSLDQIIAQSTSAFYYRRAYFEKVFRAGTGDFEGKIVYDDIAFRPQTTCRLMRNPRNGRMVGFEQEAYYLGPEISKPNRWPIQIKANRAYVYTHATWKDPLNGASDMEVAYWAWQTKQKILMLWFQFLQGVSLPRVVVKANDTTTATQIAREVSRLKSSGVLPLAVPGGPQSVGVDILDASGKGAEQFQAAIGWLDTAATASILAGFLDLTSAAGGAHGNHGSYALSKDQSDFYLQAEEAKVREIEAQVRQQIFAPLIFHNFGHDAAVPKLAFEPLNDIDKATAVELLKGAMAAPPGGPVPTSFVAELAGQVAEYLGMDGAQAKEDFKKSFDAAAAQAQAKALTEAGGSSPVGQQVAGIGGAVAAAHQAVKAGLDPRKTAAQHVREAATQSKEQQNRSTLLTKHAKNVIAAKTGGGATL